MSAALEVLRAAQQGDREACEQAVLENNGVLYGGTMAGGWTRMICTSWDVWGF